MTSALRRAEAPARGAHRILCEQIDETRRTLAGRNLSDASIHRGRKSLQRARATLRLLRAAIPEAVYRRENLALRDIARPLSAARDAQVMLETLDRLEKQYGRAARRSVPAAVRRTLKQEQTRQRQSVNRSGAQRPATASALDAAGARVAGLHLRESGWDSVGNGLQQVYRKGRRAMKQAKRTPTPECLHEWRKQTKHLWHQLQVLEPMCSGPIGELADQAHKLSDYLGEYHDLSVLRDKVRQLDMLFAEVGSAGALLALIGRRRAQLREKAVLVGGRIYEERPKRFASQFAKYWTPWRSLERRPSQCR